jgi:hypothetical protein
VSVKVGGGGYWKRKLAPSLSSLFVRAIAAGILIRGKWRKLWSALFGVIAGSFLGKF